MKAPKSEAAGMMAQNMGLTVLEEGADRVPRACLSMAPGEEDIDWMAGADVQVVLEAWNTDALARVDVLAALEAEDTGEVALVVVMQALEQDSVWETLTPLAAEVASSTLCSAGTSIPRRK